MLKLANDLDMVKEIFASYELCSVSYLEGHYHEVYPVFNEIPISAGLVLYFNKNRNAGYWTDTVHIDLRQYLSGYIIDISYGNLISFTQDFDYEWWSETLARIEDQSGVQLPLPFYEFLESLKTSNA